MKFESEPGDFEVYIGTSSQENAADVQLRFTGGGT